MRDETRRISVARNLLMERQGSSFTTIHDWRRDRGPAAGRKTTPLAPLFQPPTGEPDNLEYHRAHGVVLLKTSLRWRLQ